MAPAGPRSWGMLRSHRSRSPLCFANYPGRSSLGLQRDQVNDFILVENREDLLLQRLEEFLLLSRFDRDFEKACQQKTPAQVIKDDSLPKHEAGHRGTGWSQPRRRAGQPDVNFVAAAARSPLSMPCARQDRVQVKP